MNKNFLREYSKLNPFQKKAVDSIDGPVLVLAGPGTGKTQVLTLRIANILQKTQMNPYNILCLTFTEAGAFTMRERLTKLIGSSAYDVAIYTFHSFANSIIKEFPFTFNLMLSDTKEGQLIEFRELDDFERLRIIENLLTKNYWQYLTPLKNSLIHLKQISKLLQDFKREQITPSSLEEKINKRLLELDLMSSEEKLTKTKLAKIDIEIKKAKRTQEFISLYKMYNKKLASDKRYDYEDMVNWVVDALRSDQELSLIYQEKYQYILVDEFQDTNNSQLELVNLLTTFYSGNPNLFVVGDPNQSIYRFQGASNYNISAFETKYPKLTKIELDINYRSAQKIIDASSNVISSNTKSLRLKSSTKQRSKIEVGSYLHKEQEIYEISKKIAQLKKQKIKASDIAILLRNNNQIHDFVNALSMQKIPFQVLRGNEVLANPFIEKVLILIENIINPSDKIKFINLFYYYRENFTLRDADIIKKATLKNKILKDLSSDAKNFLQKIDSTAKKISSLPLPNALIEILNNFNITNNALNSPNRHEKLSMLKSLYNDAKTETLTIDKWLEKLRQMRVYNLDLVSEPILYGEEDAVVISTVHQSKGKEYEVVFLPQMEQSVWSKIDRSIFYVPNLESDFTEDEVAEERRLFYVALTRAKTSLYISCSKFDKERNISPSRYLEELPSNTQKTFLEDENKTIQRITKQLSQVPKLTFNQIETAWLKDIVKKQPLSPTGFTSYKNCPKDYLIKNILRIPQVKSAPQIYGSAIHLALEQFFLSFKKTARLPDLDELLGYYVNALDSEIQLSKVDKKKYLSEGSILLTNYYKTHSGDFQIPIRTEYSFHGTHLGEIPLSGKIDKIEWLDPAKKIVRVIDYKTGNVKTRNALLGLTKYKDTNYLYQLKFYQLLSKIDHKFYLNWKIGESTLEFLDSQNKFTKESFIFSDKEISDLKNEIKEVWQNIQDLKFDHNPNTRFNCEYCTLIH